MHFYLLHPTKFLQFLRESQPTIKQLKQQKYKNLFVHKYVESMDKNLNINEQI